MPDTNQPLSAGRLAEIRAHIGPRHDPANGIYNILYPRFRHEWGKPCETVAGACVAELLAEVDRLQALLNHPDHNQGAADHGMAS